MKLTCRLARTLCALRETSTSSHVASCPDCQSHFGAAASLDATLRREAATTRVAAPANFERDILRAVRESAAAEPARSAAFIPWRSLTTVGAVAATLALGSFLFQQRAKPADSTADVTAAFLQTVGSVTDRVAGEVIPNTGAILADNPLQSELAALQHDARAAVDFLALNFLPRSSALASK